MKPEQMLKDIIKAMKSGKHARWNWLLSGEENDLRIDISSGTLELDSEGVKSSFPISILDILLDPAGLRAAYGESPRYCSACFRHHSNPADCDAGFGIDDMKYFEFVATSILDAWLSSPEGDTEAAIKTAYDLLPKK